MWIIDRIGYLKDWNFNKIKIIRLINDMKN